MAKDPKTMEDILDAIDVALIRGWRRWQMMTIGQRVNVVKLVRAGADEGQVASFIKSEGIPSFEVVQLVEYVRQCVAD